MNKIIERGDLYWYSREGSVPHPCVVIQDTIINQTRIESLVICGITSNMRKAAWPGYVLLEENEGGLPHKSLVDVSQVTDIKKDDLGEYMGQLSEERVNQIFQGIQLLQRSYEA
ncbi:type II toxin-antitoxin system PemK/MazF family toxin [Spirochaeta cellobiosiphila]|uniref:type II toxin-antitoxin system PemK/MazF family toxin n=1 Tax=Spirochaeta cellobiosiphila TaxID=504483 RepID=UPI00041EA313|nr:type II toxin-antitoxin system PemK/MazF family toxin [Spirochaeta cellobiosiphila]